MELGKFVKNYSEFTNKALKSFALGKDKNVFFSPFSMAMLLAMLADATKGETHKEILNVVGEGFGKNLANIFAKIPKPFISANAVFVKKSLEQSINPEFKEKLAKYEGELFTTENYIKDVNSWVYEKTENTIFKIFDESYKPLSDAIFINAICFYGDWEIFCNDEKECEFRNSDTSLSIVNMMKYLENYYIEDDLFTGFVKPYAGEEFSFMALLPKKSGRDFFDDVLEHLDFVELFNKRKRAEVHVAMPEFECIWKGDLRKFCKNSGMDTLLSQKADFSPFLKDKIEISEILQKATIEVGTLGVKAAAVTYCKKKLASLPIKTVSLDRPFIYAIFHDDTGIPVFVGTVKRIETIRALEINFETVFDYGITDKEVKALFYKSTKCKTVEELKDFTKSTYTNTFTGDFFSYVDLSELFEFRGLKDKADEYREKADQTEFWQYKKDHPRRT